MLGFLMFTVLNGFDNILVGEYDTMKKSRKYGILSGIGLLGAAAIWGFAFTIVKNSFDYVPPTYMLAFRFAIATVALIITFRKRLKNINKTTIMNGAFIGVFLFVAYLLQTIGCVYTTAGKNAFLTTVYVILVPYFHWIFNRKKPDKYCLIAAFVAVIGVGLLTLRGDVSGANMLSAGGFGINVGDLLTLGGGVFFTLQIVFIDKYTEVQDPILLTIVQIASAAILSWIFAPILDGGFPVTVFNKVAIAGLLYLGLASTMIAFLLQNVCQKYLRPSTASLIMSTEAVFGIMGSVIFLSEIVDGKMVFGCLLILGAIVIEEIKPGSKRFLKLKSKE